MQHQHLLYFTSDATNRWVDVSKILQYIADTDIIGIVLYPRLDNIFIQYNNIVSGQVKYR